MPEGLVIPELLKPSRIERGLRVAGKDELFEALGALLNRADQALSRETILSALREREHLGATGIGLGVAVPHGRVPGLVRCVGVFPHPGAAHGLPRHRRQTCYNGFCPAGAGTGGAGC